MTQFNMNDSVPSVNLGALGFGILNHPAATPVRVSNRDDVVSNYVRLRIRQWRDGGRELQDLARVAGFAKSTPSQVLLGTGIGAKTGPRFAKAFGFESFDAMKMAAWEWWSAQGEASSTPPSEASNTAAQAVLDLKQGTPQQVQTILQAYAHPRFKDRDYDWWLQTLLSELKADREALRVDARDRAQISETHRGMQVERQRTAPPSVSARRSPKRASG